MATTTTSGFKKPEGTDTFYAFVQDVCDNIDLAEDLFSEKSDSTHNHDDRYYTEAEADALFAAKAAAAHTHDDRYYTETEADALFAAKADATHYHDGRYYTEAEVDALFAALTESGTWTPAMNNYSWDYTGTITVKNARYVKRGNAVTVTCYIKIDTVGSGNLNITGLPFSAAAGENYTIPFVLAAGESVGSGMVCTGAARVAYGTLWLGGPNGMLKGSDLSAGNTLVLTGTYLI